MRISSLKKGLAFQYNINPETMKGGAQTMVNCGGADTTAWEANPDNPNGYLATENWDTIDPGTEVGTGYCGLPGETDWTDLSNITVQDPTCTVTIGSGNGFDGNYYEISNPSGSIGITMALDAPIPLTQNTLYDVGLTADVLTGYSGFLYVYAEDNTTIIAQVTLPNTSIEGPTKVFIRFNSGSHTGIGQFRISRNYGTVANSHRIDQIFVRESGSVVGAELHLDMKAESTTHASFGTEPVLKMNSFSSLTYNELMKFDEFTGLTIGNKYTVSFRGLTDSSAAYYYIWTSTDGTNYTQVESLYGSAANTVYSYTHTFEATAESIWVAIAFNKPSTVVSSYITSLLLTSADPLTNVFINTFVPERVTEDGRLCLYIPQNESVAIGFSDDLYGAFTMDITGKSGSSVQIQDPNYNYAYRSRIYFNDADNFQEKSFNQNTLSFAAGMIGLKAENADAYIEVISSKSAVILKDAQDNLDLQLGIASTMIKDEYGKDRHSVKLLAGNSATLPEYIYDEFTLIIRARLDETSANAPYGIYPIYMGGASNHYLGLAFKTYSGGIYPGIRYAAIRDGGASSQSNCYSTATSEGARYPYGSYITMGLVYKCKDENKGSTGTFIPEKVKLFSPYYSFDLIEYMNTVNPLYTPLFNNAWNRLWAYGGTYAISDVSYIGVHNKALSDKEMELIVNANYIHT